ncbi:MAG TPA: hypothetical protein VGE52_05330 [Pirellulales bacterium]
MFRWLLILFVLPAQLLAGSGRDVYLCICQNGSCVCLDAGVESCGCCRPAEVEPDVGCSCCDHCNATPPATHAEDCGCEHLLVAAESPSIRRAAADADSAPAVIVAYLPAIDLDLRGLHRSPVERNRFESPPAFFPTVLSTVVLRC